MFRHDARLLTGPMVSRQVASLPCGTFARVQGCGMGLEQLNDLGMGTVTCFIERSCPPAIADVKGMSLREQVPRGVHLSLGSSEMKGRAAVVICTECGNATGEQPHHAAEQSLGGRPEKLDNVDGVGLVARNRAQPIPAASGVLGLPFFGPRRLELLDDGPVRPQARVVERGAAPTIHGVSAHASLEEELHDVDVPLRRGQVHRGTPVVVPPG